MSFKWLRRSELSFAQRSVHRHVSMSPICCHHHKSLASFIHTTNPVWYQSQSKVTYCSVQHFDVIMTGTSLQSASSRQILLLSTPLFAMTTWLTRHTPPASAVTASSAAAPRRSALCCVQAIKRPRHPATRACVIYSKTVLILIRPETSIERWRGKSISCGVTG